MSGFVTIDTGVLVAADRGERATWDAFERLASAGWVPSVPTAVIAEAWSNDRQVRLARALRQCRIEDLDEITARRAGELCARSGLDDPVDAIVVASASRRGGQLWTHDPHLARLAQHLPPDGPTLVVRVGSTR